MWQSAKSNWYSILNGHSNFWHNEWNCFTIDCLYLHCYNRQFLMLSRCDAREVFADEVGDMPNSLTMSVDIKER